MVTRRYFDRTPGYEGDEVEITRIINNYSGDGTVPGGSGFTFEQDEAITPPPAGSDTDTWYAPDTGASFVWVTGIGWVQFASSSVSIPNDPTLSGVVTVNGDLYIERPGSTARLYLESDAASYIVFADEDATTVAYVDVPTATGEFLLRKGDGTAFFRYNPATQQVTFPDGGVPVTQITGDLDGGAPDSTF